MNTYTINSIDPISGFINVTFIDNNGLSSEMVLAFQLNGNDFTLSDAKSLDIELLATRDNWLSQNLPKVAKVIDLSLQQYVLSMVTDPSLTLPPLLQKGI